jgi:hypothetical protein
MRANRSNVIDLEMKRAMTLALYAVLGLAVAWAIVHFASALQAVRIRKFPVEDARPYVYPRLRARISPTES